MALKRDQIGLAGALFIAIAMKHIGADLIAAHFGVSRSWAFYVAGGLMGAFLFGLFIRVSPYVAIVALWGVAEEGMTSACGAATMIWPVQPKPLQGLCDAQIGSTVVDYIGLLVAALIAFSIALRSRHG